MTINVIAPTMKTKAGRAWLLIESLEVSKTLNRFELETLRRVIFPVCAEEEKEAYRRAACAGNLHIDAA